MREKRIFEKGTKEKVSPSSRQKCTTNSFLAYTQTKKNTTFTFTAMVEKVNVVQEAFITQRQRAQLNRYYQEKLLYIRVLVVKTNATPE